MNMIGARVVDASVAVLRRLPYPIDAWRLCLFCHRWTSKARWRRHTRRCQRKYRGRTFYRRLAVVRGR